MKKFSEVPQHDFRGNSIVPKLRNVPMEMPKKIIPDPILKDKPVNLNPPQLLQDLMRFQKEAFDKVVSGFGNGNSNGNSEIGKNTSESNILSNKFHKESVSSVSTHNSQNEKTIDPLNCEKDKNQDLERERDKQGIVNFLINIAKKSNGSNEPININIETLDPEEKKKICNTLDLLKAHQSQESTEIKSKEERLNEKLRSLGILKSSDPTKSNSSQIEMKDLVNKFFKSKDPRLQPKKDENSN